MDIVRSLFKAYEHELGIDLGFQGFAQELASLPGDYAPPSGRLLLAWQGEEAVGCVALRKIDEQQCEMKRLYVAPAVRATGAGTELIQSIIAEAKAIGYGSMCLDTLPSMTRAISLYRRLGFQEIAPYRYNPVPGTLYLALTL